MMPWRGIVESMGSALSRSPPYGCHSDVPVPLKKWTTLLEQQFQGRMSTVFTVFRTDTFPSQSL